ncbi:MAG: S-layer homology domain-containing protein, partial [Solobacterium sp.]|nr:S-layer homology domain-containing protein [Solobacterium sp.]
ENCTRGHIVTFLYRAAGEPKVSGKMPFTDVKEGKFYYNAVLWAVQNNITTGTSATTFSPNENCTRGHIVTFLYRYLKEPSVSGTVPFNDVKPGKFYYNAVLWAVKNNITTGTSGTTFSPNDNCTRGQAVTFLCRAVQ